MAITFEQESRFNWKALLTVFIILVVLGVAVYYLFLAPAPAIEVIVPSSVKTATELSQAEFDPSVVVNSEVFRTLRHYSGESSKGETGRDNPFMRF